MKRKKIKINKKKLLSYFSVAVIAFVVFFFSGYGIYVHNVKRNVQIYTELASSSQGKSSKEIFSDELLANAKANFPEPEIKSLPYQVKLPELAVNAKSAIVIDERTGWILYEKNSLELIPPASMTKLFLNYVILKAVENGRVSLDDEVPLTEPMWAKNAPPHSSLMFLGQGQHVTLNEILLGMNVVSGNDAAVAASIYVCGSVDNALTEMNRVAENLGLTHTHFYEVSGYSEKNITCAREFAAFCRSYVHRFPYVMKNYHSVTSFSYPKERNLADGWTIERAKAEGVAMDGTLPITQNATNRAMNAVKGSDGLKTGYIDESGFNLALTTVQNGQRLIVVTMGGPGANSEEGNVLRSEDALTLTNWAFSTFKTVLFSFPQREYIPVYGGKNYSCSLVELKMLTEENHALCVPHLLDKSGNELSVTRQVTVTDELPSSITAGNEYGYVDYFLGDYLIESTPLVAEKTVPKGNFIRELWAKLYVTCSARVR